MDASRGALEGWEVGGAAGGEAAGVVVEGGDP
jgi:hypothetical protein